MIILIAYLNNEPIAYCDASLYRSISGKKTAYIHTLAVKKKYQGRGIGSFMLYELIERVIREGYRDIYLDSVKGLEGYYLKRGFDVVARSISYIIHV